MGLVEDDDAVEVTTQPVDDLLDPRAFALAFLGAERRVGGEEDRVAELDRGALAVA